MRGFQTTLIVGMIFAHSVYPRGVLAGSGVQESRESSQADEAAPAGAPPPPQSAEARTEADASEVGINENTAAYFARRQYLNNYLIRDRGFLILLRSASAALRADKDLEAIESLQAVWDASHDALLWNDSGQRPESARIQADELMAQASTETREAYERCFGGVAERLLESVLETHDARAERELLRRFSHTRAAGRLLELKALRAMDRGEISEAIGYWRRLLGDSWQQGGLDRPRAVEILRFCQQLQPTPHIDAGSDSDGNPVTVERSLPDTDTLPGARTVAVRQREGCDRTDDSAASPPMSQPLWTSQFLDETIRQRDTVRLVSGGAADAVDKDLEEVVADWIARQQEGRLPLCGAGGAVATGDLVIARDFTGVTARGARDGAVRWRYECESSLCGILEELAGAESDRFRGHRRTPRAELFANLVADHSTLATLTTDGERVYLIDEIKSVESTPEDDAPDANARPRRRGVLQNRLVALALDGSEQGRARWSRGGSGEAFQSELFSFYFLGPPQPYQGNLYGIGEQDDQLQIVVLDAATGSMRWKQPLSLVDLPVAEDEARSRMACLPLVDQGMVICPTHLPVLIGLDAVTGTLMWVYHAAGEERPESVTWTRPGRGSEREDRDAPPVIVDNRLLFLPPASRKLHCIDLHSGRRLWWADACQAQYVARATADMALLVSSEECIGVRLTDGSLCWRTPVDAPAGRGIVAGNSLLLPLNSGELVEIRLADGSIRPDLLATPVKESGTSPLSARGLTEVELPGRFPHSFGGNLLVHGELIVCSSATGLAVFPQARAMLDQLRSTAGTVSASDRLRRAELHMRLSERNAASAELRLLLQADPPDSLRRRGRQHLRELLYLDFSRDPASRIEELAGLVSTPTQVARYLLHRLEHELNVGQLARAAGTAGAVRDLQVRFPVRVNHNDDYLVLPLERARFMLASFAATADVAAWEGLRSALRKQLDVDQETDVARLREAATLLRGWDPDDLLTQRLAGQLRAEGEIQAAELVMMSADNDATRDRAGHAIEAEFDPRHRSIPGMDANSAETGSRAWSAEGDYIVSYHPDDDVRPESLPTVEVRETAYDELEFETDELPGSALSTISEGKSHYIHAAGRTVRLIQSPSQFSPDSVGRYSVIADDGITRLGTIETEPARWQLPESAQYSAGDLVPLRGKGLMMLSLLEQRILWNVPPNPDDDHVGPYLGPYGIDFCVLQTSQELVVVDPVSGHPLWRRRGLRHQAGLVADEETGIIGDSRVLVVFDSDGVGYDLYETRSGARLGRGELPVSASSVARGTRHLTNFGRRLMYQTEVDGQPQIRIWDPLSDRLLFETSVDGRFCCCPLLDQQRVALLVDSSCRSIDGATGECEWEFRIAEEHIEHIRKVLVLPHAGVDFVLLERHIRDADSSTSHLDVRVPSTELSGLLCAVDRASGRPMWNAPITVHPSFVLNLPHHNLSYLVLVSRVRDPQDNESYRLKVDVIDIGTGQRLGSRADLTNMAILNTSYDAASGTLMLWGEERCIEIHSSRLTSR